MKTINHFISKSLFGTGILMALLLAFSCTQDTSAENLDGVEALSTVQARATTMRPIKARLDFLFDYSDESNTIECVTGVDLFKTIVSGNMTHLGHLQTGSEFDEINNEPVSGSYLIPVRCELLSPPPAIVLKTTYRSVYVAANGDELHAIEDVTITFTSANGGFFVGTAEVNSEKSTGRFAEASGAWELKNGTFEGPPGESAERASWEIEGTITY